MPNVPDPHEPVQANHRFIRAVLNSLFANKVMHMRREYDLVSEVFEKRGGSWPKVFRGNIEHINKLKDVVKFGYENGYISKKQKWTDVKEEGSNRKEQG